MNMLSFLSNPTIWLAGLIPERDQIFFPSFFRKTIILVPSSTYTLFPRSIPFVGVSWAALYFFVQYVQTTFFEHPVLEQAWILSQI